MAQLQHANIPKEYLIHGVHQSQRMLGRGAYGVVFEGEWNSSKVAIKRHYFVLVRDHHGKLSEPYKRFLDEFPILKDLPHPNIVQVFGMVPPQSAQDTPGLVMEYMPSTLRERYGEEPLLTPREEVTLAEGVASALDYLHGRKIIHRDVTTGNIMVAEEWTVESARRGRPGLKAKLADVGCAIRMDDHSQSMSLNPGAQTYMAPETHVETGSGGKARYGPPSDVYSFGVSLLAMGVRREPPSLFVLAQRGRVEDLSELGVDHPLHGLICRCLENEPGLRPAAGDFCSGLQRVDSSQLDEERGTQTVGSEVMASKTSSGGRRGRGRADFGSSMMGATAGEVSRSVGATATALAVGSAGTRQTSRSAEERGAVPTAATNSVAVTESSQFTAAPQFRESAREAASETMAVTNPWTSAEYRQMVPALIAGLPNEDVRISVMTKGMITDSQLEELESLANRRSQNRKLLMLLGKGNAASFTMFVDILSDPVVVPASNPIHDEALPTLRALLPSFKYADR